jgi:hypothetical protein
MHVKGVGLFRYLCPDLQNLHSNKNHK